MACDSGTAAGIAIGCILGTLLVTAVVLAILYLFWKRKQAKENPGVTKKWEANENPIYDNKAFTKDETTGKKPQNGDANKLTSVDLPASYTACQERNSPDKDKDQVDNAVHAGKSKSKKTRRNLFADSRGKARTIDFPIHKAGSHGSLDGAVTPNYPEVISVSLQSQDIIGLGFNISGSLSEGIFVSQVHNRGPASESGKIQVGDRILSITISMTNMVYEDALTILSYASPYPVILQLQKAMPIPSDDPNSEDNAKLNHPVYRSQSLDDLSKINRDRWTGPRKTWTQIRRIHPTKEEEDREEIEGQLKKWSATQNIVSEESGFVRPGDMKSSASNVSTEVSLDMDEIINASGSVLTSTPGSAQVVHVEIPDQSASFTVVPGIDDTDEHGVKRKSLLEADIGVDDSGVALDAPPSKRQKDSTSEDDGQFANGLAQEASEIQDLSASKLKQIADSEVSKGDNKDEKDKESDKSKSDKRSSVSSESVSSLSSDSITENGEEQKKTGSYDVTETHSAEKENESEEKTEDTEHKTVSFADINENKITLDSIEIVQDTREEDKTTMEVTTEDFDVSVISTEVNIGESDETRDNAEISEVSVSTSPEADPHEDEVRAVLKDYFSDDPSLLEQFGFVGGELGSLNKTVDISVTNDDETVSTTKTETVESESIEVS